MEEEGVIFECEGERLVGVIHHSRPGAKIGLVLVVGGPQYRVGSHRQFLSVARSLAQTGIPVLRFDYRGMGDSEGEQRTFEDIDQDIRAAIDRLARSYPDLQEIALWGLCDAASASVFFGRHDSRVKRLVLLNPWVRSDQSFARAHLQHYYIRRILSNAFWKKLASGKFRFGRSALELVENATRAMGGGANPKRDSAGPERTGYADVSPSTRKSKNQLASQVMQGLEQFDGKVLIILSGNDLTAAEFKAEVARGWKWRRVAWRKRFVVRELPEANHTFSTDEWRHQVNRWTVSWLMQR
jgi:exosortase A-associated hydrolase 1